MKTTSLFLPGFILLLPISGIASEEPLFNHQAEFSAMSYFTAINPGGGQYNSVMTINQAPQMARYSYPKKNSSATNIFRYDKGVIWIVLAEDRSYPGIFLYQELKLGRGRGVNSHLDIFAQVKAELKDKKHLKKLGTETINGISTIHYQLRKPSPFYKNEFYTSDYWLTDSGILVKMIYKAKDVSGDYELKNIKFGKQDASLFVPPPNYEKRGNYIDWKEEKKKYEAAKK